MTRPAGPLPVAEDDLVACVACGLCLPHCPTYRVTGLEAASPRGRIAAMRAVQLEGAPVDGEFARLMDECVQCRGCEAACPSSVPFGALMAGARRTLHETGRGRSRPRRLAEWLGYRVLLPRHRLLVALTWVLLAAQRLRLVPRRFGLPRLRAGSLARPLRGEPAATADAWLFPGCVMDVWQRDVHRAALRLVRAAGGRPAVAPARCCGALHLHAGRHDEAAALARLVVGSVPGDAPVLVDSAGCGAAMREYGHLLGTPEAAAFAARVVDVHEWLAGRDLRLRRVGGRVVVQDPCHLRHVQHAHEPVHALLARAYDVATTDDDGLCCGAGGVYSLVQPGLARDVRARKVAAVRAAAGGDAAAPVASANPGCAMHLAAAGLDARHPLELLAVALDAAAGPAGER